MEALHPFHTWACWHGAARSGGMCDTPGNVCFTVHQYQCGNLALPELLGEGRWLHPAMHHSGWRKGVWGCATDTIQPCQRSVCFPDEQADLTDLGTDSSCIGRIFFNIYMKNHEMERIALIVWDPPILLGKPLYSLCIKLCCFVVLLSVKLLGQHSFLSGSITAVSTPKI